MVEFRFNISDEAFNLLMNINKDGYAEYRDTEYSSVDDFINTSNGIMTLESFKNRNCGGTFYLIDELLEHNLVESNMDSWHTTYNMSENGKSLLSNVIRKLKLEHLKTV